MDFNKVKNTTNFLCIISNPNKLYKDIQLRCHIHQTSTTKPFTDQQKKEQC